MRWLLTFVCPFRLVPRTTDASTRRLVGEGYLVTGLSGSRDLMRFAVNRNTQGIAVITDHGSTTSQVFKYVS